jgi:hypothetical protein
MVNSTASIWTKGGLLQSLADLNSFFAVPTGYRFSDPRLLYDALSARWIASGMSFNTLQNSQLYTAISRSSDPTAPWTVYTVAANTVRTLYDQPKIAASSDKVVISSVDFTCMPTCSFLGQETWVLEKADMLAGSSLRSVRYAPDPARMAIVPAQSLAPTSTEYLVYTTPTSIQVVLITGTPALGNVVWTEQANASPPISPPPNAEQGGGGRLIQTNDERLLSAVWRNDVLWAAGNEGCTPAGDTRTRSCLRVIGVSTAGGPPPPAVDFAVAKSGAYLYFPAVMLDGSGHTFLVFSESSSTTFPSASIAQVMGPANNALVLQAGLGVYNSGACGGSVNRWGDYSGAALDPVDPTRVWVAGEYAATSTDPCNWGTVVGQFVYFGPPSITGISPTVGPTVGGTRVTVTGTGLIFATAVNFGAVAGTIVSNTDTQVVVTSPAQGAGVVEVTVTTAGGTSALTPADRYTYVAPVAWLPFLGNRAFGGYSTTVYVQNAGSVAANVSIQYYDQTGRVVGAGDAKVGLVGNATWTVAQTNGNSFPGSCPGSNPNCNAGNGVIYSDQPVAAFVNEFAPGAGDDGSGYTAIPLSGTGPTLYAPTVLNGAYGGYVTGFGIINTGAVTTTVTVTYYNENGTAIPQTRSQSLAANAYWGLYQGEGGTPLPAGFKGTAKISTSPASALAAIVNEVGPGGFLTYLAAPTGGTTLAAPFIFNNAYGGYFTGMSLRNVGGGPATATISYLGTVGGTPVSRSETVSLLPVDGVVGLYHGPGNTAGLPNGFAGSATVSSNQPLVAIVNEVKGNFGTSANLFAGGQAVVHLPLVKNAHPDGYSTGMAVMNLGTGTATVTIVYYDPNTGLQVGTSPTLTLAPGAFAGVYQGPGGDGGVPAGTAATAILTVTNPLGGGLLAVIVNQQSPVSLISYTGQ